MNDRAATFLIVEDEMIIGANISLLLNQLGYEVMGIIPRGEEAIQFVRENQPDILLMDINLKGGMDGVDTVQAIQKDFDIPVIYVTANADEPNFNRAKTTRPHAFISKPFKKMDLQRAIELTLGRLDQVDDSADEGIDGAGSNFVQSDAVFVKHLDKMVKIFISDILYIEAERNYCRIHTRERNYLLAITLKDLDEKLPGNNFLRIHRSFVINIAQVTEVGHMHVVAGDKKIPFSKNYREGLMQRLQMI